MADPTNLSEVGYSAFISHASADRDTAQAICAQLEKAGYRCWIAPRDIRPGEIYLEEIIRGIESSKCLILVLSKSANKSAFVRNEVERAYSKGKPLFPVRIEDVLPSRGLELLVSTAHWVEAWRGGISGPVAELAARLADDADLIGDLPPELKKRVLWRRRARTAATLSAAAGIAFLAAATMHYLKREDGSQTNYSTPPSVAIIGGSLGRAAPSATIMVQDGYDQNGPLEIFKENVAFSAYAVTKNANKLLYTSQPDQFRGVVRSAPTFTIPLPTLPVRIVFCLTFTNGKTGLKQAVITGFTEEAPKTEFATSEAVKFAEPELFDEPSQASCAKLVSSFSRHLEKAPEIPFEVTMAERDRRTPWEGECRRNANNLALLGCNFKSSRADIGARRILAGFYPDSLTFMSDTAARGAYPRETSTAVTLPNLGPTVFAAWEYDDGSRGITKLITAQDWGGHTRPSEIAGTPAGAPTLYVVYDADYRVSWGMVLATTAKSGAWSRDGRGYSDMTAASGVLSTVLAPAELGINSSDPPPIDPPRSIWVRLKNPTGESTTFEYKVNFWQIARLGLRSLQSLDQIVSCEGTHIYGASARQVACRFVRDTKTPASAKQSAAGFLFKEIKAGSGPDTLRDLDYLKNQYTKDWKSCGSTPQYSDCPAPIFISSDEDVTSVYFRFTYWDGLESDLVVVPVK